MKYNYTKKRANNLPFNLEGLEYNKELPSIQNWVFHVLKQNDKVFWNFRVYAHNWIIFLETNVMINNYLIATKPLSEIISEYKMINI